MSLLKPRFSNDIAHCHGHIQLILGPMFSGKTTELIRRMRRYQIANYKCLLIKYAKDVRYDNNSVATHDRETLPAVSATQLSNIDTENVDVIGIDEGQFFPDIIQFAEEMAERDRVVIVAALDATYQKKGFGEILNLVPLAENVVKLNSVCMLCYGEASFTKRKTAETEIEVIGGADKYLAVCRTCYKMSPQFKRMSPAKRVARPYPSKEALAKTGVIRNLNGNLCDT